MIRFQQSRPAAVAGQFYPGNPDALRESLERSIQPPQAPPGGRVRTLIVPHAGYQYSGKTSGKAYALLQDTTDIKRVLVIAPSHRVYFHGISVGDYAAFQTPLGDMPVDVETCAKLVDKHSLISNRIDAHEEEHALEVQLPFIQHVIPDCQLVPVVCGQLEKQDFAAVGDALAEELWEPQTLWVISSDFTHYGASFGYLPFTENVAKRLEELDRGAIDQILAGDAQGFHDYINRTGATVCGATPIELLLVVLAGLDMKINATLIDYTNSGRMTHDYRHTVSYASLAITSLNGSPTTTAREQHAELLSAVDKAQLLRLARQAIDSKLYGHDIGIPDADDLSEPLNMAASCFVTLSIEGRLRGCIGSLHTTEPLFLNVIRNAQNSAFQDPRFPPLTKDEVLRVSLEISVLTPAHPIQSLDEFIVGEHGIILEKGRASAVFLPQVATEQGWDRETTLQHLALKAGLRPDDWRRGATFKVFEAIVFNDHGEGK